MCSLLIFNVFYLNFLKLKYFAAFSPIDPKSYYYKLL